MALSGVATVVTYVLVVAAFCRAPVARVTGLRESSVIIAALIAVLYFGEGDARRRYAAAGLITGGIMLLVAAR